MERLAYLLKLRLPALFRLVEALARCVVRLRFGHRIRAAEAVAIVEGTVAGQAAQIRALTLADTGALYDFLASMPPERLQYFQPHAFDREGLATVLRSRAFLNYGLLVEHELVGYALLKVAPTGSAFIGLLVHPHFGGLGLGKFIVAFLYWQAAHAGLRTRSTISRTNPASLRSHQAVADYQFVAELPNDYIMIEFPSVPRKKPELYLP